MTYCDGRRKLDLVEQLLLDLPQRPERLHPVPDIVNGDVCETGSLGVHQPFAIIGELLFDERLQPGVSIVFVPQGRRSV